jgi:hypothetical protein
MEKQPTVSPIFIGVVGIFLVIICVGIWYVTSKKDSGSPAPASGGSPAPAPAATDPRQAVWTSGKVIQSAPLEIGIPGNAPIAFTTKPSPYTPGQSAVFTMSFDLYVTGTAPSWRSIFAHSIVNNDGGARAPSVYLTGTDAAPANRVHYNFLKPDASGALVQGASVGSVVVPSNQWYNVTITCDGSTAHVYMNGTLDSAADFTGTFKWPTSDDPWNWCNSDFSQGGSVKVANTYFWNSALTTAQIAQLKVPSAPTPGVATTSYYMPEPYTSAKEVAGY